MTDAKAEQAIDCVEQWLVSSAEQLPTTAAINAIRHILILARGYLRCKHALREPDQIRLNELFCRAGWYVEPSRQTEYEKIRLLLRAIREEVSE